MKVTKLKECHPSCDFCGRFKSPYFKVEGEESYIILCEDCLRELVRKGSKEAYGD